MINILFMILLLLFPVLSFAQNVDTTKLEQPTYETVFIDGSAPITIDGDLSDWKDISAPKTSLMNSHWIDIGAKEFTGSGGLSATFQAFADKEYLYVGFEVKDDVLIFGESSQIFDQGLRDDAVEVYFDGDPSKSKNESDKYDINDGQVRVVKELDGKLRLEGQISSFGQIPYGWEGLGVIAGLKEADGGYNVEIRIPVDILGLKEFTVGTTIGFNVAVDDDDDKGDRDDKFCWSNDPKDISHLTTVVFGKLTITSLETGFKTAAKTGAVSKSLSATVNPDEEGRLIVTLTDQPIDRFMNVEDLKGNIKSLKNRLDELKINKTNKKALLSTAGLIMAKSRKEWDNTALDALDIMKEESSVSPPLKSWLAKTKVRMAEQYLLENSVSGLSDELVANTLNKFGPTGTREALFSAGVKLTNEGKYEQANEYYNKI